MVVLAVDSQIAAERESFNKVTILGNEEEDTGSQSVVSLTEGPGMRDVQAVYALVIRHREDS